VGARARLRHYPRHDCRRADPPLSARFGADRAAAVEMVLGGLWRGACHLHGR
jgi:hypothetical protein